MANEETKLAANAFAGAVLLMERKTEYLFDLACHIGLDAQIRNGQPFQIDHAWLKKHGFTGEQVADGLDTFVEASYLTRDEDGSYSINESKVIEAAPGLRWSSFTSYPMQERRNELVKLAMQHVYVAF